MEYFNEAKEVLIANAEAATETIERSLERSRTILTGPSRNPDHALPSLKSRMRSNLRGIEGTTAKERDMESSKEEDTSILQSARPNANKPIPPLPEVRRSTKAPYDISSGARSNPNLAFKGKEDSLNIESPPRPHRLATTTSITTFAPNFQHERSQSEPKPEKSLKSRNNSFGSNEVSRHYELSPPPPALPPYTTTPSRTLLRPPPLRVQTTTLYRKPPPPPAASTVSVAARSNILPHGSSTFPSTSSSQPLKDPHLSRRYIQGFRPPHSESLSKDDYGDKPDQQVRNSLYITTQNLDNYTVDANEISPSVYEDDNDEVVEIEATVPSPRPEMFERMSNVDYADDMPHTAPLSSHDESVTSDFSDEEFTAPCPDRDSASSGPSLVQCSAPLPKKATEKQDIYGLPISPHHAMLPRSAPEKTYLDTIPALRWSPPPLELENPEEGLTRDEDFAIRADEIRRRMAWWMENGEGKKGARTRRKSGDGDEGKNGGKKGNDSNGEKESKNGEKASMGRNLGRQWLDKVRKEKEG